MRPPRFERQAALARSEARYRALLDHLPDTVAVVYDRQLRAVVAAGGGLATRGLSPKDMVGKHLKELVAPEDIAILSALYRSAFEGVSTTVEVTSGLTGVDNLLDVVPVPPPKGRRILEILVVARDIGEIKARERALIEAEQRWNTAFEAAPVGIAELGLDGRFLRVNAALCSLFGYTAPELLTRAPVDITHPEDVARTQDALVHAVRPEVTVFRLEKRFLHAEGHVVWCALSAVKMYDSDGRVDHLLIHYLDITELKRVEADLQHLAIHDPLTGLLNRRGFDECFDRQVAQVARYGPLGALLIIDVDGLKLINDFEGHEAGDRALTAVADVLRGRLRVTDTIGRLGGDEFAVILPHASRAEATDLAVSIVETVRAHCPATDTRRSVTVSIGGTMFDTPGQAGAQVRSEADTSMYAAKHAGRDRSLMFPGSPNPDGHFQPTT